MIPLYSKLGIMVPLQFTLKYVYISHRLTINWVDLYFSLEHVLIMLIVLFYSFEQARSLCYQHSFSFLISHNLKNHINRIMGFQL